MPRTIHIVLPDGSDDTPDATGNHTATRNVLHSAEQAARFPGCSHCAYILREETNPTPAPAAPRIYTEADLLDGTDALLTALRAGFDAYHSTHPQYAGWTECTRLARIVRRVGGGDTYVRAAVGDMVLVKDSRGLTAWCPRVHSLVAVNSRQIQIIRTRTR